MGLSPIKITERLAPAGTVEHRIQIAMQQHWNAARRLGVRHLGGRPTKYHADMPELAFNILTDRRVIASVGYVAAMLGVSRSTLYELGKWYPPLREAIQAGRSLQESWLASILARGIRNPQGLMLIMMRYHGWKHDPKPERQSFSIAELIAKNATNNAPVDWERLDNTPTPQLSAPQSPEIGMQSTGWEE